jgi:hypothetical protein
MLQKDQSLTNRQIKELLNKTGHLYPFPNNYLGYGVPDAARLLRLMEHRPDPGRRSQELQGTGDKMHLAVKPAGENGATVFHKSDRLNVVAQERVPARKGRVLIRRAPGAARTTVVAGGEVTEINWIDPLK